MARFFNFATLSPGFSFRPNLFVTSLFNPTGDWGAVYALAHPRNPNAELICDFHSKLLTSSGIFVYRITIRNGGPLGTIVDIDF
jgi:hypothetical protein